MDTPRCNKKNRDNILHQTRLLPPCQYKGGRGSHTLTWSCSATPLKVLLMLFSPAIRPTQVLRKSLKETHLPRWHTFVNKFCFHCLLFTSSFGYGVTDIQNAKCSHSAQGSATNPVKWETKCPIYRCSNRDHMKNLATRATVSTNLTQQQYFCRILPCSS